MAIPAAAQGRSSLPRPQPCQPHVGRRSAHLLNPVGKPVDARRQRKHLRHLLQAQVQQGAQPAALKGGGEGKAEGDLGQEVGPQHLLVAACAVGALQGGGGGGSKGEGQAA
jgi:hypothetical protein